MVAEALIVPFRSVGGEEAGVRRAEGTHADWSLSALRGERLSCGLRDARVSCSNDRSRGAQDTGLSKCLPGARGRQAVCKRALRRSCLQQRRLQLKLIPPLRAG